MSDRYICKRMQLRSGNVESEEELRLLGGAYDILASKDWTSSSQEADLAAHGLDSLIDEIVYTSDLPHAKPHPSVFLEVAARLDVVADACVMVGDRMIDDISGALGVGMRAVWKENSSPWPKPEHISPTATIVHLAELPRLLRAWNGACL